MKQKNIANFQYPKRKAALAFSHFTELFNSLKTKYAMWLTSWDGFKRFSVLVSDHRCGIHRHRY